MAAIASNGLVGSDEFRANRIAHLEPSAESGALEPKVRDAFRANAVDGRQAPSRAMPSAVEPHGD